MSKQIVETLKELVASPDLASKKWICQQYDSQVMNDTITSKGDAAIVRVRDGKDKALAITTDCTPRYVEADPYEGSIQAVAETYRNISSVGATPLAITNCLNFGNPEKPEIMGQIVRSIKGITKASEVLNYPVVSGNVSLYNETDGKAIKPTPAIGGVGLLKDLNKRSGFKFQSLGDFVYVIGKNNSHIGCSIYEREILKDKTSKNCPKVDLQEEKKNSEFVRELISKELINSCHDISDGGLMVALFEMCSKNLGCEVKTKYLDEANLVNILFGEDQSRYIVAFPSSVEDSFLKLAQKSNVEIVKVGEVIKEKITISSFEIPVEELIEINENVFDKKFS